MKVADQNLLLLGAPALLCAAGGGVVYVLGDSLLKATQAIAPTVPAGDMGDVEGYAFLFRLLGAGLGQITGIVALVAGMLLLGYGGVMVLLNLAARAVYRTSPGRLLAYRVLIGADLAVLLLPAPSLVSTFFRDLLQGSFSPGPLAVTLVLAGLAALAIRNTYTGRVRLG